MTMTNMSELCLVTWFMSCCHIVTLCQLDTGCLCQNGEELTSVKPKKLTLYSFKISQFNNWTWTFGQLRIYLFAPNLMNGFEF